MSGAIREIVKSVERSPYWPSVRKDFMADGHDFCAVCGKKKSWKRSLQVHHIVPFSVDPSLELRYSNLITLCGDHHLWVGHLGWFCSWNPNVVEDAAAMLARIVNRPTKKRRNRQWWQTMFDI